MTRCRLTRTPSRTVPTRMKCSVCGAPSGGVSLNLKTNVARGITLRKDEDGNLRCQGCWWEVA